MSLQLLYSADEPSPLYSSRSRSVPKFSWVALVDLPSLLGPRDSNWRAPVEEQLNDLLKLPRGWDGYNSGAISRAMAEFTRSILSSVMTPRTPAPALVPAHGGALQLEWHEKGLDIELMIYRPVDAELTVHYHDGRPSIEEEPLTTNFDRLGQVLGELI